jgi:hypothetical protein
MLLLDQEIIGCYYDPEMPLAKSKHHQEPSPPSPSLTTILTAPLQGFTHSTPHLPLSRSSPLSQGCKVHSLQLQSIWEGPFLLPQECFPTKSADGNSLVTWNEELTHAEEWENFLLTKPQRVVPLWCK